MTKHALPLSLALCLLLIPAMTTNAQRRGAKKPAGSTPAAAKAGNEVLLPTSSPLVTFRILFMTGSAADPAGKEGLANLTASMLSD
ncbi:MAG TPA: hypothetical protein VM864_07610, partial [Pyrinomonadaceae bacterium]|nr:hypothetical protein [Pyrinomonadaceae bacterium]